MYIVELEEGVWIAPWEGDPGRTLVKDNAKLFKTETGASRALTAARKIKHRNGFPEARILSL